MSVYIKRIIKMTLHVFLTYINKYLEMYGILSTWFEAFTERIVLRWSVFFFFCKAVGTAATPGLLCQPQVIVKMIVEEQMECRLAGETEVLRENLPQHHICPSQNPTWPDPGQVISCVNVEFVQHFRDCLISQSSGVVVMIAVFVCYIYKHSHHLSQPGYHGEQWLESDGQWKC
jgi:hypothetical protein